MSRKSKNKRNRRDSHQKVHVTQNVFDSINSLLGGLLTDPTPVSIQRETLVTDPLDEVHDDFQPRQQHQTSVITQKSSAPVNHPGKKNFFEPPSAAHPLHNTICENRELRKRVIFAKGKAGKGKRKRPRFTETSKEKC